MIDNHVHVGWYTDGYHSPKEIWQAELEAELMRLLFQVPLPVRKSINL